MVFDNNSRIYFGIDPSYAGLGIARYISTTKTFDFKLISKGDRKTGCKFEDNFNLAYELSEQALNFMQDLTNTGLVVLDSLEHSKPKGVTVFSEIPFVNFGGGFAFGLFELDSMLLTKILERMDPVELKVYPPKTIRAIHGKKYNKKSSSILAMKLMRVLKDKGYKINCPVAYFREVTRGPGKGIFFDDNLSEAFFYLLFALALNEPEFGKVFEDVEEAKIFWDDSLGKVLL